MKKARLATLVICLLALALLLSACGGDAGDGRGDVVEEPQITAGDFYGCWEYEEYDNWLCINADGTYEWYNPDGTCTSGEYTIDGVELLMNDGELFFALDGEGGMIDSEGDRLFKSSLPEAWPDAEPEATLASVIAADFSGCWKYDDYDVWLYIYGDGHYDWMYENGDGYIGSWTFSDGEMHLDNDTVLYFDEDGILTDDDGDTFARSTLPNEGSDPGDSWDGLDWDSNAEDFYGCWEAYGEYIWLYIYSDGTYEWFGDYDGSDWIGTYYMLGNALVLDTSVVFVFNEYGDIVDQDGNDMYASELPDEYL